MKKKDKITVIVLLLAALLIVMLPLALQAGAEFGGSDDAGSQVVESLSEHYEPWATPLLERFLGGELPGELESLLFCVQTGIGVGVIAFFLGRLTERKKQEKKNHSQENESLNGTSRLRSNIAWFPDSPDQRQQKRRPVPDWGYLYAKRSTGATLLCIKPQKWAR